MSYLQLICFPHQIQTKTPGLPKRESEAKIKSITLLEGANPDS